MLQRIGLAQALVGRPKLVVLDEPTAGVDPAGSRKIRDLIMQLKEQGITVILSSHLLEQVQEVCDRVGIIFEGNRSIDKDISVSLSFKCHCLKLIPFRKATPTSMYMGKRLINILKLQRNP